MGNRDVKRANAVGKNVANRLAPHSVATNFQFVNTTTSASAIR